MYSLTENSIVVRDADGAFIPLDPSNRDRIAYLEWVAEGNTPAPAPAITVGAASIDYTVGIQAWLDATVSANGYDNIASCISYLNSTVDKWRADALAALHWRDAVWTAAFSMQEAAMANPTAAVPTLDEVIALLPPPTAFSWQEHAPGAAMLAASPVSES